ncbi:MAG: 50S ribosomal protein L18e [Candidatus Bathyarchaeota archaeon]|nr:MAG: 50S ribosomal protein L18e [Candidatus Bathyarchaeota archaeon]
MKRTRTTNLELIGIVRALRKKSRENEVGVWRSIADRLARSRQRRATVNVSHLRRHTRKGDTVAIPGKVLGSGKINHSLNVAAFAFSKQAKSKILGAKGKCLSIQELAEKNPKGINVKILE